MYSCLFRDVYDIKASTSVEPELQGLSKITPETSMSNVWCIYLAPFPLEIRSVEVAEMGKLFKTILNIRSVDVRNCCLTQLSLIMVKRWMGRKWPQITHSIKV